MSEKKIDFLFGFAKVKSFDQINNGKATKFNSVLSTLSEGEVAGGKNYVSRFKEAQVAETEKEYELTNDKNENSKSQTYGEMER